MACNATPHERWAAVQLVTCGYCDAPPCEPCWSLLPPCSGAPVRTHALRVRAWRKLLEDRERAKATGGE